MRILPLLLLLSASACGPDLPPSEPRETDVDFADAGTGSLVIDISGSRCPASGLVRCVPNVSGGQLQRCKPSLGANYWTINNEVCP